MVQNFYISDIPLQRASDSYNDKGIQIVVIYRDSV